MYKYKILIAYEGTRYSGWQIQPNAPSIQGDIEKALAIYVKKATRVIGAGRTDAGVHALGQVAHFLSDHPLDMRQTLYALNGMLPHDIRILEIEEVPLAFHAQYMALGKVYHYHIWQDRVLHPLYRVWRTHFPHALSLPVIRDATQLLIGQKDFASFANSGSSVKSTVRTLSRLDIVEQEGGFRFECEGDGFLYKMVRNIVGILLEVGMGKRSIADIAEILEKGDRRFAGRAAPSQGLTLVKVLYPEIISSEEKEKKTFLISS